VDGRRVGVMGGSHGGSTTLAVMAAPESGGESLARDRRGGFAAAVALYPGCRAALGSWRGNGSGTYRAVAPLLILIGDKDDWTPAAPCVELARSSRPRSIRSTSWSTRGRITRSTAIARCATWPLALT